LRIEDEVLVTAVGHRVLTSDLPRAAQAIEDLMRGDGAR
jgi:Xaa-Pro aminopeptidase